MAPAADVTPDQILAAAVRHHQDGRIPTAAALYRLVLMVRPADGNALHLLGLACTALGAPDAGHGWLSRAVTATPLLAPAQANLALRLLASRRTATAARAARGAVVAAPGQPEGYAVLSQVLLALDHPGPAWAARRRQVALRPRDAAAWLGLGQVARGAGQERAAVAAWRQAVACDPACADAHGNLGIVLKDLGDGEGGLAHHHRALALRPAEAAYHLNQGIGLRDLGLLPAAEAAFGRALTLRPGHAETLLNRSHARLIGGDYARGLADYEARWLQPGVTPRHPPGARWSGEPPGGRSVFVHSEQGLGDTLMFARYASLIAAAGGRVTLEVQAPLERLMRSLDGVDRLVVRDRDPEPACDLHVAVASLPFLFGSSPATLPARVPYLRPDPADAARWRARLDAAPGGNVDPRPRVGLVWAGNPAFPGDRFRSPRLPALLPLLAVPGVRVFALQTGDGRRDLAGGVPPGLTDLGPEVGDFLETAAVTAAMDVVITCCTAQAHLSGALGLPVWGVFNRAPEWRWFLSGERNPWYPTMRMFRQTAWGDWSAVAAALGDELARLAAGDRACLRP